MLKISLIDSGEQRRLIHGRHPAAQVQDSHFQADMDMYKRKLALSVLAIALFGAWYAFRPERLIINHRFIGAGGMKIFAYDEIFQ